MSTIRILTLSHITFTYPGATEPLFTDVSATFAPGWTAVLGDNGVGKTTLVRIALGQLIPDAGIVSPSPRAFVSGYCSQNVTHKPLNLDDFANDWSPEALSIRRDLGIDDDWPWRFDSLSGGEAKRLQIACALVTHPDVLVLDEPTNHVDQPTREQITVALRSFQGIGILVSHDIALIDAVADQCACFERNHAYGRNIAVVRMRPGNYSAAAGSSAVERRSSDNALRNARREATRIEAVKAQRKHDATMEISSAKNHRFVNPKDHDARNAIKYQHNPSTLGPASARINAQVTAAQDRVSSIVTTAKRYDGDIWIDAQASNRRELVHMDAGFIPYGDAATSNGVTIPILTIGPHDHIGISGPNGTGKTTVVNALLRAITQNEQHAGLRLPRLVIPQNTTEEDARTAMETLTTLPARERGIVLSSVAQLNADPDRMLSGGSPSPGELRKLLLCLGLRQHPHMILMDEPTNHLDLHSMQALGQALARYPGALLLVSHDEEFLRRTTSIRWTIHSDGNNAQLNISA